MQTKLFFNTNSVILAFNHRTMVCTNPSKKEKKHLKTSTAGNVRKMVPESKEYLSNGTLAITLDYVSGTECREYHVDPNVAVLNHFRSNCEGYQGKLETLCLEMATSVKKDSALKSHKDAVLRRMHGAALNYTESHPVQD